MSSGLAAIRAVDMAVARDQVGFVLTKPLALEPGTRFLYTSAGPHIVSAVLQAGVGMSVRDYASRKLFTPLGIQDWAWETDGSGVTIGSTNLSLSGIYLARIGYLFLKDGEWFGARIVPSSWVKESTRTHVRVSDMNRAEDSGYGCFWWIDEQWAGFSAHGAAGQFMFVVPRLDLVVVFTSALSFKDFPIPRGPHEGLRAARCRRGCRRGSRRGLLRLPHPRVGLYTPRDGPVLFRTRSPCPACLPHASPHPG